MNKLKLRGRPRKGKFEHFSTQTWFYAVQMVSNIGTAYALEKVFFPTRFKIVKGKVIRPRLFDRYKMGKITVGKKFVQQVEASYTNTALWFNAVLWKILDERCHDFELNAWFRSLDQNLVQFFFKSTLTVDDSIKIQVKKINQKDFKKLKNYNLLDVFTLVVLAIQMSIEKKDMDSLDKALYGYHQIRRKLQEHPIFSKFYENLLSTLELHFIQQGEHTFGSPIALMLWEDDPMMFIHPQMRMSTISEGKSVSQTISDASYLVRAQVCCFEKYYCKSDQKATIRLYYSIPLGLSLLANVDSAVLIPFAKKFFPLARFPEIIAQDKENILAMTMMFGDEQDWKSLESLVGTAVLQEIIYFNEDRFGTQLTLIWQMRLGLI